MKIKEFDILEFDEGGYSIVCKKYGDVYLVVFIFFIFFGLLFDVPVSKMVTKLCKGNENIAKIIVLLIFGAFSYALVKIIGSPVVDFLEVFFHTEFQRFYN